MEYGFRKLILGFGLTKMTQILVNWTFVTILRILSILLQYSYSTNQIRGIVLNQDQRIQSPGLVIQVKVAISRELREPNPFLLFYILILQSLPPRFYLYHNLMFYYTIYIIYKFYYITCFNMLIVTYHWIKFNRIRILILGWSASGPNAIYSNQDFLASKFVLETKLP